MDINIKCKTVKLLTSLIKCRRKFCMTLVGWQFFCFSDTMPNIIHTEEEEYNNKMGLSKFKIIILQRNLLREWKIAGD